MLSGCQRKILLASASPRRREILSMLGVDFEVHPAKVFKEVLLDDVKQLVAENARGKAEEIARMFPNELVLGVDTAGEFQGHILEKPKDRADVKRMIQMLQGQTHHIYTAIHLQLGEKVVTHTEVTAVEFHPLTDSEIESYLDSADIMDKAAAYAVQGEAAAFIKAIHGDYWSVVGLPIQALYQILKSI